MLNHSRPYYDSAHAARLPAVRRLPSGAGELERLVKAAAIGDSAAWSVLMRRFAARLRAVVRAQRLAPHDAEDVIQTTWLRLLEHIEDVRQPAAIGAWLETTARREGVRILRTTQRECPTDAEEFPPEPVEPIAQQRLAEQATSDATAAAVRSLPRGHRQLLSMLFADPAPSYEEIARALDMPIGSIGPTRARILARLRQHPAIGSTIAN